jgi:hypothetical protein
MQQIKWSWLLGGLLPWPWAGVFAVFFFFLKKVVEVEKGEKEEKRSLVVAVFHRRGR